MLDVMIWASVIAALVSTAFVSEATLGVYIIGWSCWFGIMGRLVQSAKQHEETLRVMKGEQIEKAVSDARARPASA